MVLILLLLGAKGTASPVCPAEVTLARANVMVQVSAYPKPHRVPGGTFSEMAGSSVSGCNSWCSARIQGTRIKGVSAAHPKESG